MGVQNTRTNSCLDVFVTGQFHPATETIFMPDEDMAAVLRNVYISGKKSHTGSTFALLLKCWINIIQLFGYI